MREHKTTILVAVLLCGVSMYEYGLRIADISEMPHSKRPISLFITGRE